MKSTQNKPPTKVQRIMQMAIDPQSGSLEDIATAVGTNLGYVVKVVYQRHRQGPLDMLTRARIRMSLEPARVLAERHGVTVAYINALRKGHEWDDLVCSILRSRSGTATVRRTNTS